MKEQKLWNEALSLATDFANEEIEEFPWDRFGEIGYEMGDCVHDVEDLRSLVRIAEKAKGEI